MQRLGFDPYDALRGTRVPTFVRRRARLRQVAIQVRKRSRADLAGVLGIEPFAMAKAWGAELTAMSRAVDPTTDVVRDLAGALLTDDGIARVGEGAWGYEFDVQTRWAYYPAGSPNLISTFFVGRGFGTAWAAGLVPEGRAQLDASAQFLERTFLRGEHFCYTLDNERLVHNANLLGAGLVAAACALRGDEAGVGRAVTAALISVTAQTANGSWPYGEGSRLDWIDNFHTAYILDGLLLAWLASGEKVLLTALERGLEFWLANFFEPDGAPRYIAGESPGYPHDIHSAGTAIDVAARLGTWGLDVRGVPERVADWTRHTLIAPDGTTYYQARGSSVDRRHFVRWGDAHWALAVASCAMAAGGRRDPLEVAVREAVAGRG